MKIPDTWFEIAVMLSFAMLWLSVVLALVRMVRGPTVMDRLLSFDSVTIAVVGLMVVLSALWETDLYLDLILIISLVGFVTTVAFTIYVGRRRVEDQGKERKP